MRAFLRQSNGFTQLGLVLLLVGMLLLGGTALTANRPASKSSSTLGELRAYTKQAEMLIGTQIMKTLAAKKLVPKTECRTKMRVTVAKDGTVRSVNMKRSTCTAQSRTAITGTVRSIKSLPPLPKSYTKAWLPLDFDIALGPPPGDGKSQSGKSKSGSSAAKDTVDAQDYYQEMKSQIYKHWAGEPVIYYKVDNPYDHSFWDEYTMPDTLKNQILPAAFREWEAASGGCIRIRETSTLSQAHIRVRWANNYDDKPYVGQTSARSTQKQVGINIAIMQNGRHFSLGEMKNIALHEAGHALGMWGHSPYRNDVMFYSIQPNVHHLSQRDRNTFKQVACKH